MLDRIDRNILKQLQEDGRITNLELAERVNLSPTPCLKRVRKLEERGIIAGYQAVLNPEKIGYNICSLVLLKIGNNTREAAQAFGDAVNEIPEVTECFMTTGKIDYVARVYAKDFKDYERIVKDELARLPNMVSMETLFLFGDTKSDGRIKFDV